MNAYLELTKPRLTLSAVIMVFAAFLIASVTAIDWRLLGVTLAAATALGGGVNALNQCWESELDARMPRTKQRPIPSGRVSRLHALIFGAGLSAAALVGMYVWINDITMWVGSLLLVSYVMVYTPLKQLSYLNTLVGAFPGALPIWIGWAAARGTLGLEATVLFLIMYFWQMPHFMAIAWMYRRDYDLGGFKMWASQDLEGGSRTAGRILFYSALLLPFSLLPFLMGMTGILYAWVATFSWFVLMGCGWALKMAQMVHAKKFMPISILYLFVIYLFLVVDKR